MANNKCKIFIEVVVTVPSKDHGRKFDYYTYNKQKLVPIDQAKELVEFAENPENDNEYVTSLKTYDILLDYYNNLNKYRPNDTTRRELDTATIRKFLINRDGARCFYCQRYHGQKIVEQLTIEHLIPVAHGGNDTASNLVLACHGCNNHLGNAPLKQKIDYKISLLIGDKHV